jgi:hypothetical protein
MADQYRQPSPFASISLGNSQPNTVEVSEESQKAKNYENRAQFMFTLINRLEWINPEPRAYLETMVSRFGLPDVLAHQRGGMAIWHREALKNTPLFKLEVRDEAVLSPIKGCEVNFCYTYVKYEVIPKCYEDVKNVDACLNYDSQTKLLRARGKNYEVCIALLMLGTAVGNCVVTASMIKKLNRIEEAVSFAYSKIDLFTKQLQTNLDNAAGSPLVNERTQIPFYEL